MKPPAAVCPNCRSASISRDQDGDLQCWTCGRYLRIASPARRIAQAYGPASGHGNHGPRSHGKKL
jgi:hypothetical protein